MSGSSASSGGSWRNSACMAIRRCRRRGETPSCRTVRHGNVRGSLSFASRGPNTRTTQLFINLRDNSAYDRLGFAPFAEVVMGMDVVDSLYSDYEERPDQGLIDAEGNAYLIREFPSLDYIKKAAVR